jgi:hypothetical protein
MNNANSRHHLRRESLQPPQRHDRIWHRDRRSAVLRMSGALLTWSVLVGEFSVTAALLIPRERSHQERSTVLAKSSFILFQRPSCEDRLG